MAQQQQHQKNIQYIKTTMGDINSVSDTNKKIKTLNQNKIGKLAKTIDTITDPNNNLAGYSNVYFPLNPSSMSAKSIGTYSFNDSNNPMKRIGTQLQRPDICLMNAIYSSSKTSNLVAPSNITENAYKIQIFNNDFNGNLAGLSTPATEKIVLIDPSGTMTDNIDVPTIGTAMIFGYFQPKSSGNSTFNIKIPSTTTTIYGWLGDVAVSAYKTENVNFSKEKNVYYNVAFPNVYVPFRIIYNFTNSSVNLPFSIENASKIVWTDTVSAGSTYVSLVENTPDDTKKGLFQCYSFQGDISQYGQTDEDSRNNTNTKIVELFTIDAGGDSGNYLEISPDGDLAIYSSTGNVLKELIPKFPYKRLYFNLQIDPVSSKTQNKKRLRVNTGKMELQYLNESFYNTGTNPKTFIPVESWVNDMKMNPSQSITQMYTLKRDNIQQRLVQGQTLYSSDGAFKLYFDKNGKLIMKGGTKITNNGIISTDKNNYAVWEVKTDPRAGKLYYGDSIASVLRPVPDELQVGDSKYNYTEYPGMYPLSNGGYTITDFSKNNDCHTQCTAAGNCDYFYRVTGISGSGDKCVLSNGTPLEFSSINPDPKKYGSSVLKIKNRRINIAGEPGFDNLPYDANGYANKNGYAISGNPLNSKSKPGIMGIPIVNYTKQALEQQTFGKSGTKPVGPNNNNKPVETGMITSEPFSLYEGFTLRETVAYIDENKQKLNQYVDIQNKINTNHGTITNLVTDISKNYHYMSGHDGTYHFINSLYQGQQNTNGTNVYRDVSKEKAMMDDLNIYMVEENNMYMLATLTLATIVVGAIFVARQ